MCVYFKQQIVLVIRQRKTICSSQVLKRHNQTNYTKFQEEKKQLGITLFVGVAFHIGEGAFV